MIFLAWALKGAKYFVSLDLFAGYHQIWVIPYEINQAGKSTDSDFSLLLIYESIV